MIKYAIRTAAFLALTFTGSQAFANTINVTYGFEGSNFTDPSVASVAGTLDVSFDAPAINMIADLTINAFSFTANLNDGTVYTLDETDLAPDSRVRNTSAVVYVAGPNVGFSDFSARVEIGAGTSSFSGALGDFEDFRLSFTDFGANRTYSGIAQFVIPTLSYPLGWPADVTISRLAGDVNGVPLLPPFAPAPIPLSASAYLLVAAIGALKLAARRATRG